VCGKRGLVPRYQAITVEYLTRDGKLETREFTDFVARIIQHESDHLDGILFIDRLKNSQDIYSEEEYQKIISQENSGE
jgi:peptide deformylase